MSSEVQDNPTQDMEKGLPVVSRGVRCRFSGLQQLGHNELPCPLEGRQDILVMKGMEGETYHAERLPGDLLEILNIL